MENPGLKKHNSTEPFLKVTHRRTATTAAYDPERQSWIYDLKDPNYFEDDPAPSYEGNSHQPMVHVKNDVPNYPQHWLDDDTVAPENDLLYDSYGEDDITREDRDANRIRTAAGPTMVAPRTQGIGGSVVPPEPATIRQNLQTPPPTAGTPTAQPVSATNGADPILRLPEANDAADRRRIDTQRQFGGGQKENPAYDQAQQNIREKVQQRRAHPLHQAKELTYDFQDNLSSAHLAAQVPSDDPVYPYNPQEHPEHDTTDLDNLQSGDDRFRPHHPDVDRVMNHLQGLPDMSRNDPRLMEQVNEILDEAPDTEEGNRGADALAMGLNTIFDSSRETEGLPREERLQRGKDAIDAHFEASQLSHKEHVKQLHDDWEARGGHKTGEPRPVERFSPKYTKPQRIVPNPGNPFPELESPILYVGKCDGCGKKLWDSADSSGDPRGALGDHTLGTLDAAEYDATDQSPEERTGDRRMHGPSALICPDCESDSDRRNAIEDKYQGHKAGDKTGGGYWGWPQGADTRDRSARRFIPTTYAKDRKGKWHNPGEKPGSCFECDNGITEFHRRTEPGPGELRSESAAKTPGQQAADDFLNSPDYWNLVDEGTHPEHRSVDLPHYRENYDVIPGNDQATWEPEPASASASEPSGGELDLEHMADRISQEELHGEDEEYLRNQLVNNHGFQFHQNGEYTKTDEQGNRHHVMLPGDYRRASRISTNFYSPSSEEGITHTHDNVDSALDRAAINGEYSEAKATNPHLAYRDHFLSWVRRNPDTHTGHAYRSSRYSAVQDRVSAGVQQRAAHPLHQGSSHQEGETWDYLHERPEELNLPEFYRQQGFHVHENPDTNLAFLNMPGDEAPLNPSGRGLISVQPSYYVPHDEDDTAEPGQVVGDERWTGSRFDPGDEPCSNCWVHDEEVISKREHGYLTGDKHPWRGLENPESVSRFGSVHQAHHDPDQDIKDVMAIQGADGNWDWNGYMHGMYNGMELIRSINDRDDPEFRESPKHWREEAYEKNKSKSKTSALFDTKIDEDDNLRHFHDTDFRPAPRPNDDPTVYTDQPMIDFKSIEPRPDGEMDEPYHSISSPGCETCWMNNGEEESSSEAAHRAHSYDHFFKPFNRPVGERFSALVDHRVDEDDNLRYFHDTKFRPNRAADNFTVQPMIDFKHVTPDHDFPEEMAEDVDMDQPGIHDPGNGCETCWLKNKNPHSDTYYHDDNDHKFKPFSGGGSERFSSVRHQAEMYDIDEDEETGLRHFRDTDFRPEYRGVINYSDQPMIKLKHILPTEFDDLGVGASHNPSKEGCETCWLEHGRDLTENIDHRGNYGHLFKPFTRSVGERFSAAPGESDEDFWARMEREHPGQQVDTSHVWMGGASPDAAVMQHPDPNSDWDDDDEDLDVIPENMSLRDHSMLLRSGVMGWDGSTRHPRYTTQTSREIRDSDGNRAFADEGHVIEHNTNHHGPVLPTEDNPDPHVLQYPWNHTYYPAGQSDDEGLTKGYNTPDQAMDARRQLSLWGARHPQSQELLKGYRYVGSELPYDPSVVLPHEAAMRREAAYDEERQQFLHNIESESDDPDYYLKDKPPSSWKSTGTQPFMQVKDDPYEHDLEVENPDGEVVVHRGQQPVEDSEGFMTSIPSWDDGHYNHHDYQGCLGCLDRDLESKHPDNKIHKRRNPAYSYDHEYEPIPDLAPGVRL